MWQNLQRSVCLLRLCDKFTKVLSTNNSARLLHHSICKPNQFLYNKYMYVQNYCTNTINISEGQNEPDIKAITDGNPELENKLKILILETDVMRQEGKHVPDILRDKHWKELLSLPSKSARKKFLTFLFKLEKSKENEKLKKLEKKLTWEKSKMEMVETEKDDGHIKYGLQDNNIFLRFYDTTINQMYNNKLVQAMQFGQKIVFDCSYDEHMTTREMKNCAKQLMLVFAENRLHNEPFDLHYCNINKNNETIMALHRYIKTMYEDWFPLNLHEKSYLDIFPKNKLVYLTPHCREELMEYDHDAVYIIGAMVDKINNEPLSLAKAKANNLKMAKLPLDHYLQWGAGSGKSLTLNQMINIMLDQKKTEDWNFSLRHVPRRKLEQYQQNKSPESYDSPKFKRFYSERYSSDSFKKKHPISDTTRSDLQTFRQNSGTLSYNNKDKKFTFAKRKAQFGNDEYSKIDKMKSSKFRN